MESKKKVSKNSITSCVESYLSDYRSVILMISDIIEGEKIYRFEDGLKFNIKFEVLKTNCS